jgi:hypothetical protein
MRHGDLVEILDFQLRYVDHKSVVGNEGERTTIFTAGEFGQTPAVAPGGRAPAAEARALELKLPEGVLRSAGQGGEREIVLDHALTALGGRGDEYAAIFRRPQGYFITRVEGKAPRVNGKRIADDWQPLAAATSPRSASRSWSRRSPGGTSGSAALLRFLLRLADQEAGRRDAHLEIHRRDPPGTKLATRTASRRAVRATPRRSLKRSTRAARRAGTRCAVRSAPVPRR